MLDLKQMLAQRMHKTQSSLIRELLKYSKVPGIISLAGGIPAADLFDLEGIEAALGEATKNGVAAYQYSVTDGEIELRQAITQLLSVRGITAPPESIVVTSGSQQALDLAARVLLNQGDKIVVERPTYLAALQVFGLCEAQILDVEGDEAGINPDALECLLQQHQIKALYVVANFANPTGATLTLARRQRLIALAQEYQFIIIEDDPYGSIRFAGQMLPSLYELAASNLETAQHVIYLSSFSKILVPGLRVGFAVANTVIRENIVLAKQALDLHSPVLPQRLVSAYLESGRLPERIKVLCHHYQQRCAGLMSALTAQLGDVLTFSQPEGGMFLWAHFTIEITATELLPFAVARQVVFVPGAAFYIHAPNDRTMRLSYATISPEQAQEAAIRLSLAIKDYLAAKSVLPKR